MIDFEKLLKDEQNKERKELKQKEEIKMATRTPNTNKNEKKNEIEFVDKEVVLVMSESGKSCNLYMNETVEKGEVLIISTQNLEKLVNGEYKGTSFSQIVDKE